MRYFKPISFALMFLILAVLALCFAPGCALLQIGQPQLQTYTFIYDGGEYSALLPKEVPLPPETAFLQPDWNPLFGFLYVMHVVYVPPEGPPVVSFWFTKELGVVALVFHPTLTEHIPYLYIEGLPVQVTGPEMDLKFEEWSRGPK